METQILEKLYSLAQQGFIVGMQKDSITITTQSFKHPRTWEEEQTGYIKSDQLGEVVIHNSYPYLSMDLSLCNPDTEEGIDELVELLLSAMPEEDKLRFAKSKPIIKHCPVPLNDEL
jgi:hypothetical protein